MTFEFRHGKITPRGTSRKVPQVRWVHVDADGVEKDFPCEPDGVPCLCVKVEFQTSQFVEESTRTYLNGDDVAPPPGRGWVQAGKNKEGTLWIRRRSLDQT